jgi:predicted dehydrogenase
MLNVAVLGAGWAGGVHLKAYAKNKNTNIIGVFGLPDDLTKKTADQFDCKAYFRFDQMFEENNIDIVDICLPTCLHVKYLEECRKQNVNILCEKPMVLNLEEANRLKKTFISYTKKVMFAYTLRFISGYEVAKEYMDSKKYGDLKSIYLYRLTVMPPWADWYKDENLSGGGVLDLHIHDVDYAYWLLGFPNQVNAVGCRISGTENWVQSCSVFKYPDEKYAIIEVNQNMPKSFPLNAGFRINFEDATLVYQFTALETGKEDIEPEFFGEMKLYDRSERLSEKIDLDDSDPYEKEVFYFVDSVINNKPIGLGTIEDAINGMKMVHLIKKSLKENVL